MINRKSIHESTLCSKLMFAYVYTFCQNSAKFYNKKCKLTTTFLALSNKAAFFDSLYIWMAFA